MSPVAEVSTTATASDADWIEERLEKQRGSRATSVIPGGFEAYARILHPAHAADGATLRWAEVAAANKLEVPLGREVHFHSVALPREGSDGLLELSPPERGSLGVADAQALARHLQAKTAKPGSCRFCLWDGYLWQGADTIPPEVLEGPRVNIAGRDYAIFKGSLASLPTPAPNIWWPRDRSWCVMSDLDLHWTYVGGPAALIDELVGAGDIEALPADPGDPVRRVEDWVLAWVAGGVDDLVRGGNCRISTTRGAVSAWLERPGLTPGSLGVSAESLDGRKSARRATIEHRTEEDLRRLLTLHLAMNVVSLVEK